MTSLDQLFTNKHRSYKMILIIAMIKLNSDPSEKLSLDAVGQEFRRLLVEQEKTGLVDTPPKSIGARWADANMGQIKQVLSAPINAFLSRVVELEDNTIRFRDNFLSELGNGGLKDLLKSAEVALDEYWAELAKTPRETTIHDMLTFIMENYQNAKQMQFPNHDVYKLLTKELSSRIQSLDFVSDGIKVKGSVGQGNWASVPWIALLDKRVTTTTREGIYVVYLFSEDMSACYLALNHGVTKIIEEYGRNKGYAELQSKVNSLHNELLITDMNTDDRIWLSEGGLGRDYQASTVAYIKYERNAIPDDSQLLNDLQSVLIHYQKYIKTKAFFVRDDESEYEVNSSVSELLRKVEESIRSHGFHYHQDLIRNLSISLKVKPFVILAGISGTGKSRLVSYFARAFGATHENGRYRLISVRPDWSDSTELIGYKNLQGEFNPGPLTETVLKAFDNPGVPHFILLDEMNLARIEYYLSDVLSVMETQRWESGKLVTDPLIQTDMLNQRDAARFSKLGWPSNLYLIGTVNIDDTTHPISKKVLDRATTIEFNEVDLELGLFEDASTIVEFSKEEMVALSKFLVPEYLTLRNVISFDDILRRVVDELTKLNDILMPIGAHVGYRIRDVISFFTVYGQRFQLFSESESIDLQIYQKILPRLQGSSLSVRRALIQMLEVCVDRKLLKNDVSMSDPELYKPWLTGDEAIYAKSAQKIAWMLRRMDDDGFTSFWG